MSTDQPQTYKHDELLMYYQYRLTRPHSEWDDIKEIILRFTTKYIVCLHTPDTEEDECAKEHFHFALFGLTDKNVVAMKLAISRRFNSKGNGLHAGLFRENHVRSAISYMKHDELGIFYHSGEDYWPILIDDAPTFVKGLKTRGCPKKRERLGDPTLTLSNILKQAKLFRDEHMPNTNSLQNVISRMIHQSHWVPSRDLLTNGIPREYHEMFIHRCSHHVRDYDWIKPHVPSEQKQSWLPVVDGHPIVGIVETPAGGGFTHPTI